MPSPSYKNGFSFHHHGFRFPTVMSVLAFHDDIIERYGGLVGIREPGLVDSAAGLRVAHVHWCRLNPGDAAL
jgi:hypothetical protein